MQRTCEPFGTKSSFHQTLLRNIIGLEVLPWRAWTRRQDRNQIFIFKLSQLKKMSQIMLFLLSILLCPPVFAESSHASLFVKTVEEFTIFPKEQPNNAVYRDGKLHYKAPPFNGRTSFRSMTQNHGWFLGLMKKASITVIFFSTRKTS